MIWAFEVDDDNPGFARRFFERALRHELLLRPIGNTIYFMPPYVISAEEIELLTGRTLEILGQV
jgi:adenosylmethionine-8-amino-7-oxononanoate aminotransferase